MNWPLLANSLLVAGAATLLALLLGGAVAVVLASSPALVRRGLLALTVAVLALPAFLVTNCWIDLLGVTGALHRWLPLNVFSLRGAVGILALLLWPLPALGIFSAWQKIDVAHLELDPALRGANLLRFLLLPAAKSSILVTAAITFALALNNFAVPAILQVKVYPAEVWVQFNTNLDALAALRLSWPLVLAPVLLVLFLRRAAIPWPRVGASDIAPALRRQLGSAWFGISMIVCGLGLVLSLLVPLVQLTANARTWSEFIPAFEAGQSAVLNSFLYAVTSALLTVILGLVLVRMRGLGWLWMLFLVPGVLLGIGAVTTFNRPAFYWFSRSAGIVVFMLTVRYFALAHSLVRAAHQSVDRDLIDSARVDGAAGFALFRHAVLPQIAPPLAAAAYMVYVLCLWDVETILLVLPPGGETLAVRIFNLLHFGHNSHVNALCLLLLLLALVPLAVFGLWRGLVRCRAASRISHGLALAAALWPFLSGCGNRPAENADRANLQSALFSHVEVIGSRGTGAGQFNKPRSLVCDTNDNLYVVDMTGRVQKFSPEGKFLLSWQMPQTDLGKPKGMACDREGNIVVLEPHYQRVNHFTPEGKLVAQWGVKGTNAGELTLPRSIAVDTKNNVIVSEYTLVDRVQKFSARGGRVLAAWGTPGQGTGEFNRAEGVATDSADQIYVADSCNHRIQIYTGEGKLLRAYGHAGTAAGQMSYPYDVAVDKQGRQYVCEFGNSRLQIFDAKDQSLEIIGKAGPEPGQFANPWSLALDSKGNLYVADSMNHRVQKLVRREKP